MPENYKELYTKLDNKIIELFEENRITIEELKEMRDTLVELRIKYYYDIIDKHIPRIY